MKSVNSSNLPLFLFHNYLSYPLVFSISFFLHVPILVYFFNLLLLSCISFNQIFLSFYLSPSLCLCLSVSLSSSQGRELQNIKMLFCVCYHSTNIAYEDMKEEESYQSHLYIARSSADLYLIHWPFT